MKENQDDDSQQLGEDRSITKGNMEVESLSINHEKNKKRKRSKNRIRKSRDTEADVDIDSRNGRNGRNNINGKNMDSDIESDVEVDELDNLLNEAGVALEPSGCMKVGGRLLRLRADVDDVKRSFSLTFLLIFFILFIVFEITNFYFI